MDLESLRGIAEMMKEYGLTRVKVDEGESKIDVARDLPQHGAAGAVPSYTNVGIAEDTITEPPAAAGLATADGTPCESSRISEICAPMVGVFYTAPAPGAEPFVHVGSKVKKGDTLCILEAMKLMNEVTAERDGEVVEICVNDGELVEYGRVLLRIY